MIIQESVICKNGVELTHTWSSKGNYILQNETNIKYEEAYDIPNTYTYTETKEKIETDDNIE